LVEDEFEDGHSGAGDAGLHEDPPNEKRCMNGGVAALATSSKVYIWKSKWGRPRRIQQPRF
jgi:hypothetical protein